MGDDCVTAISDPYGIVKLYYYSQGGNSILTDSFQGVRDEMLSIEPQALKYFFITNYTPSKHTFFKELHKIEPCTVNIFEHGCLVKILNYGQFGLEPLAGKDFLDLFYTILSDFFVFIHQHYPQAELALSGGIDSSFLLMLMADRGMLSKTTISCLRMCGLRQTVVIDNDLDLEYANKLALHCSKKLSIVNYDYNSQTVIDDFKLLRDALGSEYAPAMGLIGYCKSSCSDAVLVNGQNADSVLSFGSMGYPRFDGFKLTGLNGLFSRYFQFYGPNSTQNPLGLAATLLRYIYYRKTFPGAKPSFTRTSYFKGIGLSPENRFYFNEDPAYRNIEKLEELSDWFESEYLTPLFHMYGRLDDHALSLILYNKTYMQGSANRSTVLSALLAGKGIFLPYASLRLLELMTNLRPDGHYAFYGKYPNIAVGRQKIGLPSYIIERRDPNNCDSTTLVYEALRKNACFEEYIRTIMKEARFDRYREILTERFINDLKQLSTSFEASNLSTLMRFVWVESIFQDYCAN